MLGVTVAATLLSAASAKTYFKEDFNDKAWESRWTKSKSWKPSVSCELTLCILYCK